MVTARCARASGRAVPPRAKSGNEPDGADLDAGTVTTCCCMSCCYSLAPDAADAGTARRCAKTATTSRPCDAGCDVCDPPSEAAAFVASVTAAAFVLLAALLAVVLSSAVILAVFSAVPTAAAAVDVRGHQQHQQHQHQHQHQHQQWHFSRRDDRGQPVRPRYDDAARRKRQLFKDREPGIVSLTFSLIGGTVTDVKQAYRNVSAIVQETLAESVRQPTTTSEAAPAADGDQTMMAAGNAADNEIAGAAPTTTTTTTAPPVDQKLINRELRKLLGRNYRGLRRLFDSELRSAIKNSRNTVRDFTVELVGSIGQSLRPSRLFTRGPADGDNTTAASV